ncbi:MAG: hypothetical protein JHC98_09495 [Thermoleophilaceae bacterium]|nr:hypothetical protein [Thermoleophilaceae bacterium]
MLALTIALGATAGSALAAPANDDFANAEALNGNRGTTWFDLTGATAEPTEPQTSGTDERTLWFTYTPTATGLATFSICDAAEYPIDGANLTVFTGSSLATLSAESDSSGGCPDGQANASIVAMGVTAGTTYSLQLGNTAASVNIGGTLVYDFNAALPTNDDFANAKEITGALPQTLDADTGLATTEPDEPGLQPSGPFNSLWYHWTADASGAVSIDTCSTVAEDPGHPADSKLEIFTNSNAPADLIGLIGTAAADDGCSEPGLTLSRAYLNVTAGTDYWIRLVNYADKFGAPYKLTLRRVTTPEISGPPSIYPQDGHVGIGQTMYSEVPDWFAEPAITGVGIQWQLCDFTGTTCNDILGATGQTYEPVLGDLGQRLRLKVTGDNGVESVDAFSAASAPVEARPINDNFADATDLGSSAPYSIDDDNFYATSEAGENDNAIVAIDGSVWYRWTAPESRTYLVDACQSSSAYSFGVNVYSDDGSPVSALAVVNSFNGGCENGSAYSRTFFAATAGSPYLIQAGSLAGQSFADFTLTISEAPAPSFEIAPALTGSALEHAIVSVGFTETSGVLSTQATYDWTLCDSAGDNCQALADAGTNELELMAQTVGSRVKVTVTLTNANGSTSASALSGVIEPDADGDGVTDPDDDCPSEAGTRPNGCEPSDIVAGGIPTISGNTVAGQQLSATSGVWSVLHDPLGYSIAYQWLRCTSTNPESCSTIAAANSSTYTLAAGDVGQFMRVSVTASNADDSALQTSAASTVVADIPGGGATTPPPSPAANPLTLSVKKSLGTLTPKKGSVTIKGAVVTCAASATAACAGTVTLFTQQGTKLKKFAVAKISVAPGKSAPVTIKLKSSQLKAIAKARTLRVSATFSVSGPGFAPTTAAAAAKLKPEKKK